MTISYLLTTLVIVLAATIPYKAFINWRKGRANENLRYIAEKFKLSIVNSDPPQDFPVLEGTVDEVFIQIETTKTKEGGKFPVTHIIASLKPQATEEADRIKILPNKSFMETPDERYIKTGTKSVDSLYIIGVPRVELSRKLAELGKDIQDEKQPPASEEPAEISSLEPLLITFLEDGVKFTLYEGQLLFKGSSIKYSAPEYPVSKVFLERMEFLLNKLPELTRQATTGQLFK